jgi:hypothetical protein
MNEYYEEGQAAFDRGDDYCDNPYPAGSTRFEKWADGWTEEQLASCEDADFLSCEEEEDWAC